MPVVEVAQSREELSEDGPSCFFWKLFCEVDESVEFPVLFNLHDIVEDALEPAVGRSVSSSHIKVDDLNDVAMFGLVTCFDLIEKSFEDFLPFSSAPFLS